MEILREAPKASDFVPLFEHQATTPTSFYAGPPVLHYYSDRCKVLVLEHELGDAPALAALVQHSNATAKSHSTTLNGDEPHVEDGENTTQCAVDDVDVWVTSDKLLLFSSAASAGVAIPYPFISLHAIQSLPHPTPGEQQGLYMQLISASADSAEEENGPDSISITIVPTASAPPPAADENDPAEDQPEQTPVLAMFTALSNCSNLHPDDIDVQDQDQDQDQVEGSTLFQAGMILPGVAGGGLPPAMPGSGGWITSENMHEFVDEDGNWIGGDEEQEEEVLGPGAGNVRTRNEVEEVGDGIEQADETKWRRTS